MLTPDKSGRYLTILADGKLHETVHADAEGAVLREYETSDGKVGKKWEMVYRDLTGTIVDIQFRDGEFGEQIQLTFKDEDGEMTLSQGVGSNFGEDIMKKLPNVDLSKPVYLRPYAFTGEDEKMVKGVEMKQGDIKIYSYFWDLPNKKVTHGYPEFTGEKDSKDDWKIYFITARKFLVRYTKDNIKIAQGNTSKTDYPAEEIRPEDIPF